MSKQLDDSFNDSNIDDSFDDASLNFSGPDGDNLDFGDFDLEGDENARDPAKPLNLAGVLNLKEFGARSSKGFLDGITTAIKNALPNAAQGITFFTDTAEQVKRQTKDSIRDVRSQMNEIGYSVKSLLPMVERKIERETPSNVLPYVKPITGPTLTGLKKLTGNFTEPQQNQDPTKQSPEDARTALLEKRTQETTDAINNLALQQAARATNDFYKEARNQANTMISQQIENRRFNTTNSALQEIRNHSIFRTDFFRSTLSAYFKQDLQLKYRHLFATEDILELTKIHIKTTANLLDQIRHNTGLPDVVKATLTEKIGQTITANITNTGADFIKNYGANLAKNINDRVLGPIKRGLGTANMALTMGGMADMAPLSTILLTALGENSISGAVGHAVGRYAGRKVGTGLLKRTDPAVAQWLETNLGNIDVTLPLLMDKIATGERPALLEGMPDNLYSILQSSVSTIAPTIGRDSSKYLKNANLLNNPQAPGTVTNRFVATVEDVIPSYLRLQTKFLESIATGRNPNEVEEQVFSFKQGRLISTTGIRREIEADYGRSGSTAAILTGTIDALNKGEFQRNLSAEDQAYLNDNVIDMAQVIQNMARAKDPDLMSFTPKVMPWLRDVAEHGTLKDFADDYDAKKWHKAIFKQNVGDHKKAAAAILKFLLKDPETNRRLNTLVTNNIGALIRFGYMDAGDEQLTKNLQGYGYGTVSGLEKFYQHDKFGNRVVNERLGIQLNRDLNYNRFNLRDRDDIDLEKLRKGEYRDYSIHDGQYISNAESLRYLTTHADGMIEGAIQKVTDTTIKAAGAVGRKVGLGGIMDRTSQAIDSGISKISGRVADRIHNNIRSGFVMDDVAPACIEWMAQHEEIEPLIPLLFVHKGNTLLFRKQWQFRLIYQLFHQYPQLVDAFYDLEKYASDNSDEAKWVIASLPPMLKRLWEADIESTKAALASDNPRENLAKLMNTSDNYTSIKKPSVLDTTAEISRAAKRLARKVANRDIDPDKAKLMLRELRRRAMLNAKNLSDKEIPIFDKSITEAFTQLRAAAERYPNVRLAEATVGELHAQAREAMARAANSPLGQSVASNFSRVSDAYHNAHIADLGSTIRAHAARQMGAVRPVVTDAATTALHTVLGTPDDLTPADSTANTATVTSTSSTQPVTPAATPSTAQSTSATTSQTSTAPATQSAPSTSSTTTQATSTSIGGTPGTPSSPTASIGISPSSDTIISLIGAAVNQFLSHRDSIAGGLGIPVGGTASSTVTAATANAQLSFFDRMRDAMQRALHNDRDQANQEAVNGTSSATTSAINNLQRAADVNILVPYLKAQQDLLTEIRDMIDKGITVNVTGSEVTTNKRGFLSRLFSRRSKDNGTDDGPRRPAKKHGKLYNAAAGLFTAAKFGMWDAPLTIVGGTLNRSFGLGRATLSNEVSEVRAAPTANESLEDTKVFITKEQFRAGVFAKRNGKGRLRSVHDIRGVVYDAKGVPFFTKQDLKNGLVDGKGRPIRTWDKAIGRFIHNKVGAVVSGSLGITKKALNFIGEMAPVRVAWRIVNSPISAAMAGIIKYRDVYSGKHPPRTPEGKLNDPLVSVEDFRQNLVCYEDGNPVKDVYSINRAVIWRNIPGNGDKAGQAAITNEDIRSGLLDVHGHSLSSISRRLGSGIRRAISSSASLIGTVAKVSYKATKWGVTTTGKMLVKAFKAANPYIDVYVDSPENERKGGDRVPTLLGKKIQDGVEHASRAEYFYRDGSIVTSAYGIKGEVLDRDGNTLIEEKDLPYLNDINRHHLSAWRGKSLVGKFISLNTGVVTGLAKLTWKGLRGTMRGVTGIGKFLTKGLWRLGADAIKIAYGSVKDILNVVLNGGSIVNRQDLEEVVGNKLENIYVLLYETLKKKVSGDSNGDGTRDNSYEEYKKRKQQRDAAYEAAAAAGTNPQHAKRNGSLLGGLWSFMRGGGAAGAAVGAAAGAAVADATEPNDGNSGGSSIVDTVLGTTAGMWLSKHGGQALKLAGKAVKPIAVGAAIIYAGYKAYSWLTDSSIVENLRNIRGMWYGFPKPQEQEKLIEDVEDIAREVLSSKRTTWPLDEETYLLIGKRLSIYLPMTDTDPKTRKRKAAYIQAWLGDRVIPIYDVYLQVINSATGEKNLYSEPDPDKLGSEEAAKTIIGNINGMIRDRIVNARDLIPTPEGFKAWWSKNYQQDTNFDKDIQEGKAKGGTTLAAGAATKSQTPEEAHAAKLENLELQRQRKLAEWNNQIAKAQNDIKTVDENRNNSDMLNLSPGIVYGGSLGIAFQKNQDQFDKIKKNAKTEIATLKEKIAQLEKAKPNEISGLIGETPSSETAKSSDTTSATEEKSEKSWLEQTYDKAQQHTEKMLNTWTKNLDGGLTNPAKDKDGKSQGGINDPMSPFYDSILKATGIKRELTHHKVDGVDYTVEGNPEDPTVLTATIKDLNREEALRLYVLTKHRLDSNKPLSDSDKAYNVYIKMRRKGKTPYDIGILALEMINHGRLLTEEERRGSKSAIKDKGEEAKKELGTDINQQMKEAIDREVQQLESKMPTIYSSSSDKTTPFLQSAQDTLQNIQSEQGQSYPTSAISQKSPQSTSDSSTEASSPAELAARPSMNDSIANATKDTSLGTNTSNASANYNPYANRPETGQYQTQPQVTLDVSNLESASIPDGGVGDLGSYVKRWESGGRGPKAIGKDSRGGTSYGTYQLAVRTGTFREFLKWARINGGVFGKSISDAFSTMSKSDLDAGKTGPGAVLWQKFANINDGKSLHQLETNYIADTHYGRALKNIKDPNAKALINKDRGLREALWSTAVQHGPGDPTNGAAGIFNSTYKPGISAADWLKAIYAKRGTQFNKAKPNERAAVLKRFKEELPVVLGLSKTTNAESNTTTPADTGKPDTSKMDGESMNTAPVTLYAKDQPADASSTSSGASRATETSGSTGTGTAQLSPEQVKQLPQSVSESIEQLKSLGVKAYNTTGGGGYKGVAKVNPDLLARFTAAVKEFQNTTGKTISITSAWRSPADQRSLQGTAGAGKVGRSPHQRGEALDIGNASGGGVKGRGYGVGTIADAFEEVAKKYGLYRPYNPLNRTGRALRNEEQHFELNKKAIDTKSPESLGLDGGVPINSKEQHPGAVPPDTGNKTSDGTQVSSSDTTKLGLSPAAASSPDAVSSSDQASTHSAPTISTSSIAQDTQERHTSAPDDKAGTGAAPADATTVANAGSASTVSTATSTGVSNATLEPQAPVSNNTNNNAQVRSLSYLDQSAADHGPVSSDAILGITDVLRLHSKYLETLCTQTSGLPEMTKTITTRTSSQDLGQRPATSSDSSQLSPLDMAFAKFLGDGSPIIQAIQALKGTLASTDSSNAAPSTANVPYRRSVSDRFTTDVTVPIDVTKRYPAH